MQELPSGWAPRTDSLLLLVGLKTGRRLRIVDVRLLNPVCHGFILHGHLAERRDIISVGQVGAQAPALCGEFAQMHHISRNITHTNKLACVVDAEHRYKYRLGPNLR